MTGLLRGLMGMGLAMTVTLNNHLREALGAMGGRKVPAPNAANRAAALGLMTAWAMMARANRDISYYSRLGI